MKKQTGLRAFFRGSLALMFLGAAVFALSGCGGEKKPAPAPKKAEAPAGAKGAMPTGHPAVGSSTEDIARASHSLIKTSKKVKISDKVRKTWKSVTVEISNLSEKATKTVELKVGSTTQLTDDGYKVKVEVFVPDYAIEGDHIKSRSNDPKNPAALIDLMKDGKVETRGWIFAQFPEFNSFNSKKFGFVLKAAARVNDKAKAGKAKAGKKK